jgi:5-methylcytosine-specific restriction protein A
MRKMYLSLMQGMTHLENTMGKSEAVEALKLGRKILLHKITLEIPDTFSAQNIELHAGASQRPKMYEFGHVVGKQYFVDSIPTTDILLHDLAKMLKLYDLLFERGGTINLNLDITTPDSHTNMQEYSDIERRRRYKHSLLERNHKLVQAAKKIHGYKCQVCQFDFESNYGEIGRDFIEAHHLKPLSQYEEGETPRLSPEHDFAVVCSNCHQMLHRKGAPESFDEFIVYFQRLHS